MKRFLILSITLGALNSISFAQTKPYQFIAKMYSEGLGRIPDAISWNYHENAIQNSFGYFQSFSKDIFKSSEFRNIYSDTTNGVGWEARLLCLYRGILNRDPDLVGFTGALTQLKQSVKTWNQIVDEFTSSSEFSTLVSNIISRANNGMAYYGWTNNPPIKIHNNGSPTNKNYFNGTRKELYNLLNSINDFDSVQIAPMALIEIDSTLIIPRNKTLTTAGTPGHLKYAKMGRLARSINLSNKDMIKLLDGSVLKNVWIDGQQSRLGKETLSVSVRFEDYGSGVKSNVKILN